MKRKVNSSLSDAAEKQRLKQLCKDFETMIKKEDGARFFVFMMECYNNFDVDSFIDFVSAAVLPSLAADKQQDANLTV